MRSQKTKEKIKQDRDKLITLLLLLGFKMRLSTYIEYHETYAVIPRSEGNVWEVKNKWVINFSKYHCRISNLKTSKKMYFNQAYKFITEEFNRGEEI